MTRPLRDSSVFLPALDGARQDRHALLVPSTPLEVEVVGLFDQFRVPLLRYVISFGLPVEDAEEIVQEVFLALFLHLLRGKSRSNLRGWVFRVGHNMALKQRFRNSRRERSRHDEGAADEQLDPDPNPEEQAARAQRSRKLLAVLHALPERDRFCLNLRAEGLRYREIAEVLGMSLGAVSLSLGRSLSRLSASGG